MSQNKQQANKFKPVEQIHIGVCFHLRGHNKNKNKIVIFTVIDLIVYSRMNNVTVSTWCDRWTRPGQSSHHSGRTLSSHYFDPWERLTELRAFAVCLVWLTTCTIHFSIMLFSFCQVEQFWGFYSYFVRPGDLSGHSDIHLFKDGIKPMWEVRMDQV